MEGNGTDLRCPHAGFSSTRVIWLVAGTSPEGEDTCRLVLCDMCWDRVRLAAIDNTIGRVAKIMGMNMAAGVTLTVAAQKYEGTGCWPAKEGV